MQICDFWCEILQLDKMIRSVRLLVENDNNLQLGKKIDGLLGETLTCIMVTAWKLLVVGGRGSVEHLSVGNKSFDLGESKPPSSASL